MGFRISTNVASVNAQRNLGNSQMKINDSLAKLASGSRINKAADDAAGLAISEKMKALLVIGSKVQETGKAVLPEHVDRAKKAGATDTEMHDTVLIAALFCLYNRYVDGLGTFCPEDPAYYQKLASRLVTIGYERPKDALARAGEDQYK